jgi:hypothetical protein
MCPRYLTKEISPDFSAMYFYNNVPAAKIQPLHFKRRAGNARRKKGPPEGTIAIHPGKLNSFSSNK